MFRSRTKCLKLYYLLAVPGTSNKYRISPPSISQVYSIAIAVAIRLFSCREEALMQPSFTLIQGLQNILM